MASAAWETGRYVGDALPPRSDPGWTARHGADAFAAESVFDATEGLLDPGFLRLDSRGSQADRPSYELAGAAWNVSTAFTFQVRLRVLDHTGYQNAVQVFAGDATRRFTLSVSANRAQFGNQAITLDATQWHVYHVTGIQADGTWSFALHLDEPSPVYHHPGYAATSNQVLVGDTSATGDTCGGLFEIDRIRWNNRAAVPLPEVDRTFTLPVDQADWVYEYERWHVAGSALRQPVANGYFEKLWLPHAAFGDLDFSVEFMIASNSMGGVLSAGILYGGQSPLEFNWVRFNGRDRSVEWYRSDTIRSANSGKGCAAPNLEFDTWHTARVVAQGPLHSVYLDGELLFTRTDATLQDGTIGLFTAQAAAAFRNLAVHGGPVPPRPSFFVASLPYFDVATDAGAGAYEAFPDLARAANGDLLCVFYAGYKHVPSGPDERLPQGGRIAMVRSRDEGRTWSPPVTLHDGVATDDHDPTITRLRDGRLAVSICAYPVEGRHKPYLIWSHDHGHTWTGLQRLDQPDPFARTEVPSGPLVELPDGTLLMPTYGEALVGDTATSVVVRRSTDGGQTWPWDPGQIIRSGDPADPGLYEPCLLRLPGGKLIMISRQKMFYCESLDDGQTWSAPVAMEVRGDSPYLLRTSSGIVLCGIRYRGNAYGRGRGTALLYSLDEGASWSAPVTIAPVLGAYTSLLEMPDGRILVVYYTEGEGSDIRGAFLTVDATGIQVLGPAPPLSPTLLRFY